MRGSPTGELFFDGVRVGPEAVLGAVDEGFRVVMSGLDLERAFLSYLGLGVAEECLERSLKYAQERNQFGAPIAQYQLIQAKLADMYASLFAARQASNAAIQLVQDGGRASKECAAALLIASEQAVKTAEEAVQIHGGAGYLRESAVQRYWRDSKLATIGAGTSEIRRLLIARELLGQR
jgi:isovaleryl-CoA dehydrogenase